MKLQFGLFVLLFSIVTVVHSQAFTYDTTRSLYAEGDTGEVFDFTIKFVTLDSSDVTFKWKTIENTLGFSWSYSLCDYTNCYFNIPDSGTMTPILTSDFQSGVAGFFNLLVSTDAVARNGVLKLYVYNSNDISEGDTIRFEIKTNGMATDTTDTADTTDTIGGFYDTKSNASQVSLYPNPANDVITVSAASITQIQVLGITGSVVLQENFQATKTVKIDMAELPAGIYSIFVHSNDQVLVRKFIKE
jgi:hypothetical protein